MLLRVSETICSRHSIPHVYVIPNRQIAIVVRRLDSHVSWRVTQYGSQRRGCLTVGAEHDCNVALQSLLHPKVENHFQREARSEK